MATRRVSKVIMGDGNPLTDKSDGDDFDAGHGIESIAGSHVLKPSEFRDILDVLQAMDDNKARINYLDKAKRGYLFNCKQLHDMVMITESLKTRIAFIDLVCPRITDPQTMSQAFVDMFRFEDDKAKVEAAFKARLETVKASAFTAKGGSALAGGGRGGGGRGGGRGGAGAGRGGAGRGAGRGGAGRGGSTAAAPPPAITPIGIKPAIKPVVPVKPVVVAAPTPQAEEAQERPSMTDYDPSEAEDKPVVLPAKPVKTPIQCIRHVSIVKKEILTAEEEAERIAKEIKAAEEEKVVELTPEERKIKAQIHLVMAALDLTAADFAEGAFAELEMWELAAKRMTDEELEDQELRKKKRNASIGGARKASISFGSSDETTLTEADVNPNPLPTTKLMPWEMAEVVIVDASGSTGTPTDSAPASLPDSPVRRASASASTPKGTPMAGGMEMHAEEMPEAGVLSKMKAAFEQKSTPEVTTPIQKSGARNIFSPTRVSNSPAGSVTPQPNRPLSVSVQNAVSSNTAGVIAFEGGVEIGGVKYNNTQLELAKSYAHAAQMDHISFLALTSEASVEKDDKGEALYSYQELLRKHFVKKYDTCDPKRLELFLAEKDFQLVFNMTKLEWEKLPAWKKLSKRQSSLLF